MSTKLMTKVYRSTIEHSCYRAKVFYDSRGYFLESFRNSLLEDIGYKETVQENQVKSYKEFRGYIAIKISQGKLVWVSKEQFWILQ